MRVGPLDRVDAKRLAEEHALLSRVYRLAELPRLADMLAEREGEATVQFEFFKISDHAAAKISLRARPRVTCQRCMRPIDWPVEGTSMVEFARQNEVDGFDPSHELHLTDDGFVSLKDMAEEELLLALPLAPMCDDRKTCAGRTAVKKAAPQVAAAETQRPFAGLKDLLKRT
jgi:uncharacterized metal-binding protein YceD (DUF177 family)